MALNLADNDCARPLEIADAGRVMLRQETGHDLGTGFGDDALGIDIVFDANGNAVQWTAPLARRHLGIGARRRRPRFVGEDVGVGMHDWFRFFNRAQIRFHQLQGRNLVRAQHVADFAQ